MTFTDQVLSVAYAYAQAEGLKLKTVSHRAFDESRLLDGLAEGRSSLTLARADKALLWFSRHWPEGLLWPEAVARPEINMVNAAVSASKTPEIDLDGAKIPDLAVSS